MAKYLNRATVCALLLTMSGSMTLFAAQFRWDGDGGTGNEQFSYMNGGKYVNWAGDPASLPGPNDYLNLDQPGGLAIIDGNFITDGAHSYVSAAGGFTLRIPSNTSWSVGATSSAKYLYLGQRTNETAAIELTGGTLAGINIYVGYELSTGLLSIVQGNAAFSNTLYIGHNGGRIGPSGPVGIVTIYKDGVLDCYSNGTKSTTIQIGCNIDTTNRNIGILDMRGGRINAAAYTVEISIGHASGPEGYFCGYGTVTNPPSQSPGLFPFLRVRRPYFIADGHGVNRDLDLSTCRYNFEEIYTNKAHETFGLYAVRKGRLLMPMAPSIATGGNFISGAHTYTKNNFDPYLVNSVVCSNITYSGTGLANTMAVLATDRDGLTLPLPPPNIIGVWEFTPTKNISNIARITFRYDHAAAKTQDLQEESLRLFHFDGTSWKRLNATVNTDKKQIYITNYAFDAGTQLFAVGTLRGSKSTVLIVQ